LNNTTPDNTREQVVELPLTELHPFKDHPFKVVNDEKMQDTAQSIREQTRRTTEAFMQDERPIGEIMGGYLKESREMFVGTEEGRSFLDAVAVIADPSQSNEIADLLEAIANAQAFEGVEWEQRRRLTDAWNQVSQGIDRVLEAKNRATNVISHAVSQFDNTDQRALSKALKQLDHLAHVWAASARLDDTLNVDVSTQRTSIHALMTREANLTPARPAPPIATHVNDGQTIDLDRLVREGGPQTLRLLEKVSERPVRTKDGLVDVAATFNALPEHERRSSEVVGFLEHLDSTTQANALWHCVGLDGTLLAWEGPAIMLTDDQLALVTEEIAHG